MRRTSRSLMLLSGLVMWVTVAAVPAMADTITYNFTGNVTSVGTFLSPPFSTSNSPSAMIGTMTVNTADGNTGSSTLGSYQIQGLTVTIGGYTASVGPTGTVSIQNGTPGNDRFEVSAPGQPGNLSGGIVNSLAPRLFEVNLRGPNSLISSDALPSSVPSISSFTTNQYRLQFGPTNGANAQVRGQLTALTAVPLPASLILFGIGVVALIGLGAGGLRNIRLPQA